MIIKFGIYKKLNLVKLEYSIILNLLSSLIEFEQKHSRRLYSNTRKSVLSIIFDSVFRINFVRWPTSVTTKLTFSLQKFPPYGKLNFSLQNLLSHSKTLLPVGDQKKLP